MGNWRKERKPVEAQEIENYFRGRRWPDLIYYFKRWDRSLSTTAFMTPAGFALTVPAYLLAALLWPDVLDTGVLIAILLAPAVKEPNSSDETFEETKSGLFPDQLARVTESRRQKFAVVHESLSPSQRAAIGRALKHLVQHNPGYPESYTSLTRQEMQTEIERLWGGETTR